MQNNQTNELTRRYIAAVEHEINVPAQPVNAVATALTADQETGEEFKCQCYLCRGTNKQGGV